MQLGQRLALTGIVVAQKGHSLVVGGGGTAAAFLVSVALRARLKAFTTRKIAKAIIKKEMIVLIKRP